MRLSTRGRYGTRAMLDLALHCGRGPVSIRDISRRSGISERYLANIMAKLVSRHLVKSIRGQNGGFLLAREPKDIRLSEVIAVLEGSIAPVECAEDPGCCRNAPTCVSCVIWNRLKEAVFATLDAVTLAEMVRMHEERSSVKKEQMYYI